MENGQWGYVIYKEEKGELYVEDVWNRNSEPLRKDLEPLVENETSKYAVLKRAMYIMDNGSENAMGNDITKWRSVTAILADGGQLDIYFNSGMRCNTLSNIEFFEGEDWPPLQSISYILEKDI